MRPVQEKTIDTWLGETFKANRNKTAIVEGINRITYGELEKKINQYGCYFKRRGISKGELVVLRIPNVKEFVFALLGLIKIGSIPIVTNSLFGENELKGIFDKTDASTLVFYDKDEVSLRIHKVRASRQICKIAVKDIAEGLKEDTENIIEENKELDSIALLMLSSGTTGIPKLVPITHRMIYWHIYGYNQKFQFTSSDSYLACLPIAHKVGLYSPGILNVFFAGGKAVLCSNLDCDDVFAQVEKENITITALVPTLARIWNQYLNQECGYDLSSVRKIIIGGSLVDESLVTKLIEKMECEVLPLYGATEGLALYSIYDRSNLGDAVGYHYSVSGYEEIRIIDENGMDVLNGEEGELIIRGPFTIQSYYNQEVSMKDKFTSDGFYRTGDKVRWDSTYGYQVQGRITDQINRSGEKIEPREIEIFISEHPNIDEAVVVGVEDFLMGERICAFIMTPDEKINLSHIRKFLMEKGLATYKLPDQLVKIDEWPLTSVKKINRVKLREIANNTAGKEKI